MARLLVCLTALFFITSFVCADEIVTIAGTGRPGDGGDGGPALQAELDLPFGLGLAPDGSLYFCEYDGQVVRRLDLQTGVLTTVAGIAHQKGQAGDGQPATKAHLSAPHELVFDDQGNWLIACSSSETIRQVNWKTGLISTFAGSGEAGFSGDGGPATRAKMSYPISVALHPTLGALICDIKNHRIRRVDLKTGVISTWAGTGTKGPTPDGAPLAGTPLNGPRTLAVEPNGNVVIVLREGNAVYRVDLKSGTYQHVAGTGKKGYSGDGGDARQATLAGPKGVAIDHRGNILLCDTENHSIRFIDTQSGIITTVAGNGKAGDGPDGPPTQCQLRRPHGIFVSPDGTIYIGDSYNHKVRKLTLQ